MSTSSQTVMLNECGAPQCGVAEESKHPYSRAAVSDVGVLRLRCGFAWRTRNSAQGDKGR